MVRLTFLIFILLPSLSVSGQAFGYDEYMGLIKLYKDGQYDIVAAKLKNKGYTLDKYTPDYELDGVNYKGDFSFKKRKEFYYKNNNTYGSPIELINEWTFTTKEYPSYSEFEIQFKFDDQLAKVLYNSVKETWIREIGNPTKTDQNSCFYSGTPGTDECAFFYDDREVHGKDVESNNSLITLKPIHRFRIEVSEFMKATQVFQGDLHYRLVKYPIEQNPDEYFKNQSLGASVQTIPLKKRGSLYLIELQIAGKKIDYIVDSGASDINISKATESYLVELGVIRPDDYLKPQVYTLADGTQREYKRIMLSRISVGGIVVENISASISDNNSPLLLGKSFLDKFSYWKINNENSTVEFKLK
jgi:clan AA aspartic protease (TIGR02281 family)